MYGHLVEVRMLRGREDGTCDHEVGCVHAPQKGEGVCRKSLPVVIAGGDGVQKASRPSSMAVVNSRSEALAWDTPLC